MTTLDTPNVPFVRLRFAAVTLLFFGCAATEDPTTVPGNGGNTSSGQGGGSSTQGGWQGLGGSSTAGATVTGSGGAMAKGGTTSTGSGGATTTGSGGATTTGSGGATTTGTGGAATTTACDATFKVGNDGFVRMPAKGGACWHGYAFGGGDTTSMVTFPGGAKDFSMSMGVLELKGTVGSATAANSYAGNVYFGFNIGQAAGSSTVGTVTPTGTSLTVTCTGCGTPPMRVQLQGVGGGTDATKRWCANLTSGTALPYAMFKTNCWDTTGTAYANQPLEAIQVTIPGAAASAAFDFTVTSVTEN
jgi:hypothetical protein